MGGGPALSLRSHRTERQRSLSAVPTLAKTNRRTECGSQAGPPRCCRIYFAKDHGQGIERASWNRRLADDHGQSDIEEANPARTGFSSM
jgi:hypothetical protein